MGKVTGFLEYRRKKPPERKPEERINDFRDMYVNPSEAELKEQAARCMNCGVPFCHTGCPLGNIIPDWNDLTYLGQYRDAIDRLHATNNFPDFTGRVCPAPCENSCVLAINDDPVTIKSIEWNIIDRAFKEGWVKAEPARMKTGKKVAVVGSGPAGLAAAQQLCRAGHDVTVFERADRIGGLLRYGIPEFKLEKKVVDRRLDQMKAEGVQFRASCNVGKDVSGQQLLKDFDAIVLAGGATLPRDLKAPGRENKGVHFAMDFLTQQNKVCEGDQLDPSTRISAEGKHVIVIGGGDTGADCVATSHRQKAKSVTQLELLPKPPEKRAADNPWPEWARIVRPSYALAEGGNIDYSVSTKEFVGENGVLKKIRLVRLEWVKSSNGTPPQMKEIPGSEFEIPADLVFLAMGFLGPEKDGILAQLGVQLDQRGNVQCDARFQTSVPKVFAAGDMRRGQSLVVWAIAEGRQAARAVDEFLMGVSQLEVPGGV
ncbi:MAG: glutamate synthase subunit beta [Bdellovibrionota bacterium]